jgi:nucleoside-diphosphate-sugar epimerase
MKILISGASGYVGKRIVTQLLVRRHSIVAASRHPVEGLPAWVPFDLDSCTAFTIPEDVDLVLHLATNSALTSDDGQSESRASRALIDAATARGIKIIFASSQTAREDAPTEYGRNKWRIERDVLAANGLVVRLGQVYGGPENGLFGSMVSICRRLPVLPAFLPAPLIQPIHLDDCSRAFVALAEGRNFPARVYSLGAAVPIPFTVFLRAISSVRLRQRRLFVPVPVILIRLTLRTLGNSFGERTGLGRLNSLFGLHPMETASDLADLGLEPRSLAAGMHRSGSNRRRHLVQEAQTLFQYVLRVAPELGLIRRYVRMIEALRSGVPLCLSKWLIHCPTGLALFDTSSQHVNPASPELNWRLHAAIVLAEASVQGATRFIALNENKGMLSSIYTMAWAIAAESFWRAISPLLRLGLKAKADDFGLPE